MDDQVLLELSDHQLLLIGGDSGSAEGLVFRFDFDNGFVLDGTLLTPRQGHVSLLVPKHYARCQTKKNRRMWENSESDSSLRSELDSSSSSSSSSSESESHSHSHGH